MDTAVLLMSFQFCRAAVRFFLASRCSIPYFSHHDDHIYSVMEEVIKVQMLEWVDSKVCEVSLTIKHRNNDLIKFHNIVSY